MKRRQFEVIVTGDKIGGLESAIDVAAEDLAISDIRIDSWTESADAHEVRVIVSGVA